MALESSDNGSPATVDGYSSTSKRPICGTGVGASLALHRAELHRILLAGFGDTPIRWGCGPEAVTMHEDRVGVELSVGSSARYHLVPGPDVDDRSLRWPGLL